MRKQLYILLVFILTSIVSNGQDLVFCGTQANNTIFSYDPVTRNSTLIATGQTLIRRIRVDQNVEQVFWSAGALNKIQKVDANAAGSNRVDVKTNITNVATINVDAANNKVYYHLANGSSVFSCDTNGLNTTTLLNLGGSTTVLGIEIDADNNFIYWTEITPALRTIRRANLTTGANATTIFSSTDLIFDIKLIAEDSSIYFTNRNGNLLQKIKTDGTGLQTIVDEPNSQIIGTISGDYCNNVLYYYMVGAGNGVQIKKVALNSTTPTIVLDTSLVRLNGLDVFFQFNLGKKENFLGPNSTICFADSTILNAKTRGATYLWNDNSTAATLKVKQSGTYSVTVTAGNCSKVDSITITVNPNFRVNLGTDTSLCFGDSITLNALTPAASYVWSNNSTSATLKVKQAGIYWADVTVNGCTIRDSITINFSPDIQPRLGNDTVFCFGDSIFLDATATSASYLWSDNSTNPALKVKQSGIYSVTVTSGNCSKVDSIIVTVSPIFNVNLGADTVLCFGDSILLRATVPGASYSWSNNSTADTLKVKQAGTYWLDATVNGCTVRDSIRISINPNFQPNLGNDTILCFGDSIILNARATSVGYQWNDNSTNATLKVKQSGIYSVTVSRGNCAKVDSVTVTIDPKVAIDLGADTLLCFGDSTLLLNATLPSATYVWSDNSTAPTLLVKQPGFYWVDVTVNGCTESDSIRINFSPDIQPNLGNDTALCPGSTILLDVSIPGVSYRWNDNSTGPLFNVRDSGIYSVTVTLGSCTAVDSIVITSSSSTFNLGNDSILTVGDSLVLDASSASGSLRWSDNSTGQTLKVKTTGIYWVDVTISGCTTRDSISVIFKPINSTSISGIINDYTKINSIGLGFCNDTLVVQNPAAFAVGEKVLIIQMQGASSNTTNTPSFGDVLNLNSAGLHEFATIGEVRMDTFVLSAPLSNNYDANGALQMVSFPSFTNVVVTDTLTAKNWDGETGGILAFEVTNVLNLAAEINVDGKGFRGGKSNFGNYAQDAANCGRTNIFAPRGNFNGGQKGEGISILDTLKGFGRGHSSNGGGGGNSSNAGGAGGGNAGVGGDGGDERSNCGRTAVGGIGGEAINYASFPDRTLMGGGGGGGDANDGLGTDGGSGGGIVLIKASNLFGLNQTISSKGITAELATIDGAGGGGAGGAILLDISTFTTPLAINVDGGNGGNNNNNTPCFATGGGGGSGIFKSSTNPPFFVRFSIQRGEPGIITNPFSQCPFSNYGSTGGQSGLILRNVQNIFGPSPNINTFSINLGADTVLCFGDSLMLDVTSQDASYLWSDSSTDSYIVVKQPGTYWAQVTIQNCIYRDSITVNYFSDFNLHLGSDTTLCFNESILLDATTPSASYLWSDSSTAATLVANKSDTYWVQVSVNGCTKRDSISIQIKNETPPFLGNDTTICFNDSIPFNLNIPGATYEWSDGSTDSAFTIYTAGTYWLDLKLDGCVTRDSIVVAVISPSLVNLGEDTLVCFGDSLVLTIDVPNSNILWSDNSTTNAITVNTAGIYFVDVSLQGCSLKDTIVVSFSRNIGNNFLGTDTSLCDGDFINFDFGTTQNQSLLWNDSSTTPTKTLNKSGLYWMEISDNGCLNRDSLTLTIKERPIISLGPDTSLCEGTLFGASYPNSNSSYLWNTGSNDAAILANASGTYWLEVLLDGCIFRDSLELQVKPIPSLDLGADTTLCLGDTITLSPSTLNANYLWSDSTISNSLNAFATNDYWLELTVDGCSNRDSIRVEVFDSLGISFLPETAILCNNEVLQIDLPLQNSNYLWQDGSVDQSYTIADSGLYVVIISNTCGSRTDSLQVTKECECEVIVPTAFSPNNDFINDQFTPRISCELETYYLEIYNRWGVSVFQTTQQKRSWDGRINGRELNGGVYYYVLQYKARNEQLQTVKGTVLLSK